MGITHWIAWVLFAGVDVLVLADGARLVLGPHWQQPRRNTLAYTLPLAVVLGTVCALTQTL